MKEKRNPAAAETASGAQADDHSEQAVVTKSNFNASDDQLHPLKATEPDVIVITIDPIQSAPGYYEVRLLGHVEVIVKKSRIPFCDAARELLQRGAHGSTILVSRRSRSAMEHLRARVGFAATLTVEESAFGPVFRTFRLPSGSGGVTTGTFKSTGRC